MSPILDIFDFQHTCVPARQHSRFFKLEKACRSILVNLIGDTDSHRCYESVMAETGLVKVHASFLFRVPRVVLPHNRESPTKLIVEVEVPDRLDV
jgi:hypothetical protein